MAKRTAFVTGAGRGIGRAIAVELARRGMDLVLVGRADLTTCEETAGHCRVYGVETLVSMGDIGVAADRARHVRAALERFGQVDVLVTCAAIRPTMSLLDTSQQDWRQMLEVNLTSAFFFSQAFLPAMIAQGWGRVIGFTGMNAIRGIHKGGVAASKHGQWGLIKSINYEFAARGVTANAISPGPIALDNAAEDAARAPAPAIVPMARRGTTSEVAALAGFLASDEAAYISGQMLAPNGGAVT